MGNIINDSLKIESEIPSFMVVNFGFEWEPNCHGILQINGYIDYNDECEIETLYGSKVKIIQLMRSEWRPIFNGYIINVTIKKVGNVMTIFLMARSTTCMLDIILEDKSFQKVEKTYAEVIREIVKNSGGQVVCIEGESEKIGHPLIQYHESVWDFCKRLGSYIENCIVADITAGQPSLWFGMRRGEYIQGIEESEYNINMKCLSKEEGEMIYEIESRNFYKIGDKIAFCGNDLTVSSVKATFKQGELIYRYVLRNMLKYKQILFNKLFTGIGFKGIITDVQGEKVKIALDIDKDVVEGEYLFEWYPETGNGLYAMPEIGVKAILFIPSRDERQGFVVHCLPNEIGTVAEYCNKYFINARGQSFHVFMESASLHRGIRHGVSVGDQYISVDCMQNISIIANDQIRIIASKIFINSLDNLDICQG